MTTQANIQIGRSLLDGIEAHDLSQWEAVLADNFTASYPAARPAMNMELNQEQAKAYNATFLAAFSDLHFEVRSVVADGEKIVYVWDATGTHDGPLALPAGVIPATHNKANVPGVLSVELKNGKIVREETYWNQVELLAQLGLMSTEQNKPTAGRWFLDIIAQGQLAVADEITAANHVIHDPHAAPGGWPTGPDGLKMVASVFRGGFSGWNITLEDQIAEGDKVATRWTASATHTGPLLGIPPTGRSVRVTGVNVARFAEGKIAESWFNFDMLTLLQQLGAIPTPE